VETPWHRSSPLGQADASVVLQVVVGQTWASFLRKFLKRTLGLVRVSSLVQIIRAMPIFLNNPRAHIKTVSITSVTNAQHLMSKVW
jgi:hypothetical protein